MKTKNWILGVIVGVGVGACFGMYNAYNDWKLNPGGIFQNEQGTDWIVVMDTFTSWWLPVSGWVTVVTWVMFYLASYFKTK